MEDLVLACADCGRSFTFTGAEQAFYRERGFAQPKRCRECRESRRRNAPDRGGNRGPRPRKVEVRRVRVPATAGTGPGAQFTGEALLRRPPRTMHAAVCTVCGAATEVPFVPDGVRPVFCMACLKQQTR